jgi:serpin B
VSGDFAFNLYRKLIVKDQNMFISPFSLSTALAMTYAGARGETEKQMARALGFPIPQEALHDEMAELLPTLKGNNGVELHTANAIWPSKNYPFGPSYIELLKNKYAAEVKELDYSKSENACKAINSWTSEQTKKKIKEIVSREHVSVNTLMVLTNAIYFNGPWAAEFESSRTQNQEFHVFGNKTVEVRMMNRLGEAGFFKNEEVAVLELPYKDDRFSMIVILPADKEGLIPLENKLNLEMLYNWISSLKKQRVNINLPKFEVESEFELKKELTALGMVDAFTGSADFSGMETRADSGGKGKLSISDVVHKAVVTVGEEGTEAAAASAVVMRISLPPRFYPDHPFMFVIRDKKTDKNLFIGRIVDPSSGD